MPRWCGYYFSILSYLYKYIMFYYCFSMIKKNIFDNNKILIEFLSLNKSQETKTDTYQNVLQDTTMLRH